jgi:hypothetical protein
MATPVKYCSSLTSDTWGMGGTCKAICHRKMQATDGEQMLTRNIVGTFLDFLGEPPHQAAKPAEV